MRRLCFLPLLILIPLLSTTAAPQREVIREAIARGAKYLKDNPTLYMSTRTGQVAVTGLALLEAEVPPDDPAVQKITDLIREKCLSEIKTYDLAMALMYLDRLGEPADVPLIQYMGARLVVGQMAIGTWTYSWGPEVSPAEAITLRKALTGETVLKGRDPSQGLPQGGNDAPKPKTPAKKIVPVTIDPNTKEPVPEPEPKKGAARLHPEVQRMLERAAKAPRGGGNDVEFGSAGGGDHSNTQFAMIALWCSRKHAVPVDAALLRTEQYFRNCQNPDGGWAYMRAGFSGSSAAMTCPGLISLAMGHGLRKPAKNKEAEFDPARDPWMKKGLTRLGQYLIDGKDGGGAVLRGNMDLASDYYFIWSLERVGMIYGIDTMNNVDWYDWGTQILLKNQGTNGGWSGGGYHGTSPDLDTAFAMLFLCKANLAKDLSANLKGRVRDPGVTLKGGKDLESLLPDPNKPEPEMRPAPKTAVPPKPETVPVVIPDPVALSPRDIQVRDLSESLVKATAATRGTILTQLRDTKGAVYTEALGLACRKLEGEPLKEAREALASRLARMTANTLKDLLEDPNREIRRAALLACAMKEERSRIPEMIQSLGDADPVVNRAARAALKSISGKDFGPEVDASPAEVRAAIARWKEWHEQSK